MAESTSLKRGPGPGAVPWWQPVGLAALAGGMGWGIRGQYGHETGAMIAGVLVGFVLVLLLARQAPALSAARAVAWFTIAIGFGGSMTYAQTIGLTHDAALVGHEAAWRWGMVGLALKGAIWIGFAGVFLGMGLGGVRYRIRELLLLMAMLLILYWAGCRLINEPFDPARRVLPRLYFSADWRWLPEAVLKPRREVWGGLLLGLLALAGYCRWGRGDRLAFRLALWAMLGGAVGFPLGQCLQSHHAWHPELYREGIWATLDPVMNWWNIMETTFGAVMGAALGLGLWLNRHRVTWDPSPRVELLPAAEWVLLAVHGLLLWIGEFHPVSVLDSIADLGLAMGVIPIVAVATGRWWPFLLLFPVTLAPVAGKTLRQLGYEEHALNLPLAWVGYAVVPVLLATVAAGWAVRVAAARGQEGERFLRRGLLVSVWIYFWLNHAFFHYPWPWEKWTYRTLNGLVYTACALGLTAVALWKPRAGPKEPCAGARH